MTAHSESKHADQLFVPCRCSLLRSQSNWLLQWYKVCCRCVAGHTDSKKEELCRTPYAGFEHPAPKAEWTRDRLRNMSCPQAVSKGKESLARGRRPLLLPNNPSCGNPSRFWAYEPLAAPRRVLAHPSIFKGPQPAVTAYQPYMLLPSTLSKACNSHRSM